MSKRKQKALQNEHARFLSKIKKVDDCWEWQGTLSHNGYGQVCLWRNNKWRTIRAHRYSYEYFNNAKLGDAIVMHTCDNPKCVNPDHLIAGSMLDNVKDMLQKGRGAHATYIDKSEEEHIKFLYFCLHLQQRDIAKMYNVTQSQISRIINNKAWKEQYSV